jgi:hypothetical protein
MKVAWMTFLPTDGWVAQALLRKLDGKGEPVELVQIPPRRDLTFLEIMDMVAGLNEEYQAVAFMVNAATVEAARNHKIKNFRQAGATFAQWLCPEFEDGGKKVRWCVVG